MATVGNLVVNLMGNTQHLQQSLDNAQGMLSSFKGRLSAVMAGIAATFGAKESVSAARGQIEAEARLSAVLKATGGAAEVTSKEIISLAGDLQGLTGVSDDATIGAAALLATFENIKGGNFKETLRLAQDLSVLMKTDMQTAAQMLGKALTDPAEGMARLRKAGVFLTQAQQDNINRLQSQGDTGGAQAALLAAVRGKVGGVAENVADPLLKLKQMIGDVLESIGFMILPTINKIADGFSKLFKPLADGADNAKASGQAIADGLGPMIDMFMDALSIIRDLVQWSQQVPDTWKRIAYVAGVLTSTLLMLVAAYKAVAIAKAFMLALSGPAGIAVIGLAIAATSALGSAMMEVHDKYTKTNAAKKESESLAKREAEAAKEAAAAIRKQAAARLAAREAEAKRVQDSFKSLNVDPQGALMRKRADLTRDAELYAMLTGRQNMLPKNNADVRTAIENQVSGIPDAIREAELELKVLTGEMTEIDRKVAAFADKTAPQAQLDRIRYILTTQEAITKAKERETELTERTMKLLSDIRTPFEQFRDEMAQIDSLRRGGRIDAQQAGLAEQRLASQLFPEQAAIGGVGAAEQGSQAAFSAIQAAIRSGQKDEIAKQQLDVAKKQLAEMEKQTDLRREQAQAPAGLPSVGI